MSEEERTPSSQIDRGQVNGGGVLSGGKAKEKGGKQQAEGQHGELVAL